ncbi:MAG: TraR/DksA C4-type zinc finger protein [Gemmatimonadetes bacterium]|nr:TraR/DksA C4-type zinc finger protein [Gemmatimonadota bacterium]
MDVAPAGKAAPRTGAAAPRAAAKRGSGGGTGTGARGARVKEAHYRRKLMETRESILKNLEGLRDELRGLQEPSHELEEWAQEEKERDILILQEQRQEEELSRIQIALQRIDQGTYGQCARCGRPIGDERLEEVPTAVFCMNCQP